MLSLHDTFLLLKKDNKFYTNIIEDKHNLLLFSNTISANKCVDFLSHHKQIYGDWPMIETFSSKHNNNVKVELKKIPVPKRLELKEIKNSLMVDKCDLTFVYFLQKVTNLNVLSVNDFDYTLHNEKIEIFLKASELELYQDIDEKNLFNFMSLSFDLLYYSKDKDSYDSDDFIDILGM